MPQEMLLINPKSRRKPRRKAATSTKRRVIRRRRNPVPAVARTIGSSVRRRQAPRRTNPIKSVRRAMKRRRNPIGMGSMTAGIGMQLKAAAIGGAGAVGMDVLMGYANRFLPATLQRTPGVLGVGDAVKALLTVAAGKVLSKPTRGLSQKMATGALTVQAADIIRSLMPAGVTLGGLGYGNPTPVLNVSNRVGPIRPGAKVQNMAAYQRSRQTPLLSGVGAYNRAGMTPLLSGSARMREGAVR